MQSESRAKLDSIPACADPHAFASANPDAGIRRSPAEELPAAKILNTDVRSSITDSLAAPIFDAEAIGPESGNLAAAILHTHARGSQTQSFATAKLDSIRHTDAWYRTDRRRWLDRLSDGWWRLDRLSGGWWRREHKRSRRSRSLSFSESRNAKTGDGREEQLALHGWNLMRKEATKQQRAVP